MPEPIPINADPPEEEEQETDGVVRLTLSDGNWVEMTVQYSGRDLLTMMELEGIDPTDQKTVLRVYPKVMGLVERHTVRHSFAVADILEQSIPVLTQILNLFKNARVGEAVPKVKGNRSQRRSPRKR